MPLLSGLPDAVVGQARRAELDPLWDELARRMGASGRPVTAVTLQGLAEGSRRCLADLLGAERLPAATCRVRTAAVASALGLDAGGLRALVEGLRGPLSNRARHSPFACRVPGRSPPLPYSLCC